VSQEIIDMAAECGFHVRWQHKDVEAIKVKRLVDFAEKIAAAERNKLAAWMIQFGFATGHGDTMEELVDALGSEIVDRIEFEIDAAVARDRKDRA
jgi:hypothetical protein